MGDIRCPKSVDIDLKEENGIVNHWFRSESELQNEGKGGFLCGKIRITGVDQSSECVKKIRLSLVSNHSSQLHCNMLRIGLNSFHKQFHKKEDSTQGGDGTMTPTAYSVVLTRQSENTFKIDLSNHGYLPSGLKEVAFWDESTQTLTLGEKSSQSNRLENSLHPEKESGLCLTIVKPLSKQDQKKESSKRYCHIREVLMKRMEEKFLNQLTEDKNLVTEEQNHQELERLKNEFAKKELNEDSSALKRRKERKEKTLESILAEGEMHKGQLKVEVYIGPKNEFENNNNEWEKVWCTSKWIQASNRYGFKISKSTNALILDHSSIWLLTVFLDTCKITSKMPIEAQFLYGRNGYGYKEEISTEEIEILPINGKSVCRDKLGQVALQIFLKTNSGESNSDTKLNRVRNENEFGIYLRLRVLDESGYVGAEDIINVRCEPHDCPYDKTLSEKDQEYGNIIRDETIQRWQKDGKLTHLPCTACRLMGMHARTEYLSKSPIASQASKRRSSHHSGSKNNEKKCRIYGK